MAVCLTSFDLFDICLLIAGFQNFTGPEWGLGNDVDFPDDPESVSDALTVSATRCRTTDALKSFAVHLPSACLFLKFSSFRNCFVCFNT